MKSSWPFPLAQGEVPPLGQTLSSGGCSLFTVLMALVLPLEDVTISMLTTGVDTGECGPWEPLLLLETQSKTLKILTIGFLGNQIISKI